MPVSKFTLSASDLKACLPGASIAIPGCTSLRFLVTPSGYGTFFRRYRSGTALRQHHIGYWGTRLPDGTWRHDLGRDGEPSISLEEACRRVAEERVLKRAKRRQGEVHDPAAERRAKASAARQAKEAARRGRQAARLTVQALWEGKDGYLLKGLADARPATRKLVSEIYARDIRPRLGPLPVGTVTEADVRAMLDAIEARGQGPGRHPSSRGNRGARKLARAWVSAAFEWGLARWPEQFTGNPVARVDRERRRQTRVARRGQRDVPIRTRSLSHAELAVLLQGLGHELLADYLRLVLATGCRASELRLAEARELDLEQGAWTVPADREGRKVGVPHTYYLGPWALAIARRRVAAVGGQGLLFPHLPGRPYSPERVRLFVRSTEYRLRLERFSLHDCRRTLETRLIERPFSLNADLVHRATGHVDLASVKAAYQAGANLEADVREVFHVWNAHLARLEAGEGAELVALPTRRGS